MSTLRLHYTGSFQDEGAFLQSEDALNEVWSRVDQLSHTEFLRNNFKPDDPNLDFAPIIRFASIRLRQAIGFRESSRHGTTLTSPLALYYSFLNLARASLALLSDKVGQPAHGLKFQGASDLLSSGATIANGTFFEYIRFTGSSCVPSLQFTLKECFERIVEIASDSSFEHAIGESSLVEPVRVEAYIRGQVFLHFSNHLSSFRTQWIKDFPQIATVCDLSEEGNVLVVSEDQSQRENQLDLISRFCYEYLLDDLVFHSSPRWYQIRSVRPGLIFPREGYYLAAMFILGSVVRYQPELVYDTLNSGSTLSWLLQRFLVAAERYFPQLVLRRLYNQPLYFSHAG